MYVCIQYISITLLILHVTNYTIDFIFCPPPPFMFKIFSAPPPPHWSKIFCGPSKFPPAPYPALVMTGPLKFRSAHKIPPSGDVPRNSVLNELRKC